MEVHAVAIAWRDFILVLGYLASGSSAEDIIREYPDLTQERIRACLDYARDLAEFEVPV
jgi:uncharacterized protein (DUF433 family)